MAKITRKGGATNAAAGDSASRYVYPIGVVDLKGSEPAAESVQPVERPARSARVGAWREYVESLGVELAGGETKSDLVRLADEAEN